MYIASTSSSLKPVLSIISSLLLPCLTMLIAKLRTSSDPLIFPNLLISLSIKTIFSEIFNISFFWCSNKFPTTIKYSLIYLEVLFMLCAYSIIEFLFDLKFWIWSKNNNIKATKINKIDKNIKISKFDNKKSINITHIFMILWKIAINNFGN